MDHRHLQNGLKRVFFLSFWSMPSLQASPIPLVYGSQPSSSNHCNSRSDEYSVKLSAWIFLSKTTQSFGEWKTRSLVSQRLKVAPCSEP